MVQAALPDLNTQWIMAKREAWTAIKNENWNALFGALFDINAMLPKDKDRNYQIEISDTKYNNAIKQDLIYICKTCSENCKHCTSGEGECKAEIKKNMVKIEDVKTDMLVSVLTNNQTERIWICPKCNQSNLLSNTKIIQTVLKEPYFLQIVPNPPSRKDGMMDRRNYPKIVTRWALNFMNELSYQMSRYRLEYKPKEQDDLSEALIDGQENLDDFQA